MPDITITDLTGGRNGIDSPIQLGDNQCVEAINVDWEDGPVATKRRGAVVVTTGAVDLTAGAMSFYRHIPDGDEGVAELWVVDANGVFVRLTTSGWATVSTSDAITGRKQDVAFQTFNGKLFIAYKSAVDRLHVFDPALGSIRRVGLAATSAAPTAANTGSGAWPAVTRYYRVRTIDYNGTLVNRRSEPSSTLTFTPSGTGTATRITKPTLPGEGETHWEIEAAQTADGPWYVLAGVATGNPVVVATTTFDDSTLDAALILLDTAEESGLFTLPTSVKFLATDGNHLLMAGANSSGNKTSRVWFTPALGSADHGDDERLVSTDTVKGWVDLNEKDGGAISGLSNPIGGTPVAFKYRQTWKLVPTNVEDAVFIPRKMSTAVGCIYFKTIVEAEDASGNPMIAWLSHKGPFRFGTEGINKIGRDIDDIWFGRFGQSRVNLEATTQVAHGVYHTDRYQIWWYVATGTYNSPNKKYMLDVRRNIMSDDGFGMRGGWAIHTGKSCEVVCSVMFANTVGASMSRDLKPYVGYLTPA